MKLLELSLRQFLLVYQRVAKNAEQAVNHIKKSEPVQEATDFVETNILNDDEPIQKTEEFFDDEEGEIKEGWENL